MTTVSKVCAKSAAAALLKLKAGMRIYILKKTQIRNLPGRFFTRVRPSKDGREKVGSKSEVNTTNGVFKWRGEMTQLCTSCARQPAGGEINRVNVSDDFEIMA